MQYGRLSKKQDRPLLQAVLMEQIPQTPKEKPMRPSMRLIFAVAFFAVLTLGAVFVSRRIVPAQDLTLPVEGDPIILKGGSLTIWCPANEQCFNFNTTSKKYEHKSSAKKVTKIVVKDEQGNVLFSATSPSFPNGKPSVEITYK